jgi:hypothetical protein
MENYNTQGLRGSESGVFAHPLRECAFTDTARGQFPNGFDSLHLVDAKFEIIQGEK